MKQRQQEGGDVPTLLAFLIIMIKYMRKQTEVNTSADNGSQTVFIKEDIVTEKG